MSGGCKRLLRVLEGNVDLGQSALRGEFSLGDSGLFCCGLGPIGDNGLNDLLELFVDGGVGGGRFDGRGVCRGQSSTIHVGSVSRRVRASWGGVGRGRFA